MRPILLTVNGVQTTAQIDPRTILTDFLRDHLKLTGTHIGCDTSQCGCCLVLVDGVAVKSCSILVVQLSGASIVTIEGLSKSPDALHPMQRAFAEHHALQCGFCTPGMVMAGIDIVRRHGGDLSRETIRENLNGNFCRCTGYQNIVTAIQSAASELSTNAEVG